MGLYDNYMVWYRYAIYTREGDQIIKTLYSPLSLYRDTVRFEIIWLRYGIKRNN